MTARARLDASRTAKARTILTAPIVGHNGPVPFAGPAAWLVDTETGERTWLGADSGPLWAPRAARFVTGLLGARGGVDG